MVSLRCKLMVKYELERLHLKYIRIELGTVEIEENITNAVKQELKLNLAISGLELLDDKKSILIDKIKTVIIEMIHHSEDIPRVNCSYFISQKLGCDYTYLSNLFSEAEGITIQHFIIKHKIEKAKELLLDNELNLTEISHKLHYSSVAHLSNQFKKITGSTPSIFKSLGELRKENLENL